MKTKLFSKVSVVGCIALASILCTGCDDLFEPALENNNELSQMYTNPEFARGILDNAYLALGYTDSQYATLAATDVATDDAVTNELDNSYMKMATGGWASNMNPMNQWDSRNHAIMYCNLMLANCDKVEWSYSSEALRQMFNDNYKGNAYALRGLHMFYLLRAHAGMANGELLGVPIHTEPEDASSDFNVPRNTFKECYDQIMSDFDEALKYLPEHYGDVEMAQVPAKYVALGADDAEYNRAFGSHHRGKIDGVIIAALKAQVALLAASPAFQASGATTWENAAKTAADCLNKIGGLANMQQDGWKWYSTSAVETLGASSDNPAEIIWRGNIGDFNSWESDNYPPSIEGNGRVNPTQNLVDAFPMANGYPISASASGFDATNPYNNRDPRLKEYILVNGEKMGSSNTEIITSPDNASNLSGLNRINGRSTKTGYYLRKQLRTNINLNPETTQKHLPVRIRATEIFLDYAEAANEAQGPTANVGGASFSAYDVIKALRKRAGVGGDDDPYLEECKASKEKMRELIRNERRLELCFEGLRFWDLRRWKSDLTEPARGVLISNDTYTYFNVESRDYKDYMIYGPIPYSETIKFSNLQQNDGWK